MFTTATIRFWMLSHFGDSIERGASNLRFVLLIALIILICIAAANILSSGSMTGD